MEAFKSVIITAVVMISGCAYRAHEVDQAINYTIEQNALGVYVFCRSGDCLPPTPKVIATPVAPAAYSMPMISHTAEYTVYFSLGSARLGAEAKRVLSMALPKLKGMDTIYLRGWADSHGGRHTAINRKLAMRRAQAVRGWLRAHGVKGRIRIASHPACCNTDNTRAVVIRW